MEYSLLSQQSKNLCEYAIRNVEHYKNVAAAAEYGDVDVDISVSTCHAPLSVTDLDVSQWTSPPLSNIQIRC